MTEPQRNSDPNSLSPEFRPFFDAVMADLEIAGHPFRAIECRRTHERQAWIFGSGRTRPGGRTTSKDGSDGVWEQSDIDAGLVPQAELGKSRKSRHQNGDAADVWPVNASGLVYCPPAMIVGINGRRTLNPVWRILADTAERHGLRAGATWGDFNHIEMRSM